ncbi:glycosyl transferase [Geomonas sp. Red276]
MKIIAVNSSDTFGGAARAAYRLHQGLLGLGVESRMLVQRKFSDDPTVLGPQGVLGRGMGLARNVLDRLPLALYRSRCDAPFSPGLVPSPTVGELNRLAPDIVHLHWIGEGMASIASLPRIVAPVVWTLHDSWPFTGGCHVPHGCGSFRERCGRCPQLGSSLGCDLSRLLWGMKEQSVRRLKPVMVAPSRWLAGRAAESSVMAGRRIEVIPNGIDAAVFAPADKEAAKRMLGIDPATKVLLFSAVDGARHHHKGFHLLVRALESCAREVAGFADAHLLLVVGSAPPPEPLELPVEVRYAGRLQDDLGISLTYNAADLYLAPALLENFSTTVLESLSCGTPCVAFAAGGMADLVEHGENGYLAAAYDADDFARGILWALADGERPAALGRRGRDKVLREFAIGRVATRYAGLYEELCRPSR